MFAFAKNVYLQGYQSQGTAQGFVAEQLFKL